MPLIRADVWKRPNMQNNTIQRGDVLNIPRSQMQKKYIANAKCAR